MILFKQFENIDYNLYQKLDKFILNNFDNSRLYTYEYIIYFTNDNDNDNDNNNDNEEIIGFIGLQMIKFNIIINQLCVDINHRNKGIACKMLDYIEELFDSFNLYLYIHKLEDMKLYNFYIKRGFNQIYKDNVKIKMMKELKKKF